MEATQMTIANGIKKLERAGWTVVKRERLYVASKAGCSHVIDFHPNGEDKPENSLTCLRVRRLTDLDDMQSDYCAGAFVDSMAQALRLAVR
jgi:hypothetical protein